MPPLNPRIFFDLYRLQYDLRGCMAMIVSPSSASTHLGYFYMLPPLHLRIFLICHECGKEIDIARAHYASASTCLGYCFRVASCPPYTLEKSKIFWSRSNIVQIMGE